MILTRLLNFLIKLVAYFLSFVLSQFDNKSRRVLTKNIKHVLGYPEGSLESRDYIKKVYFSHAVILCETLAVILFRKDVVFTEFNDFSKELRNLQEHKPTFIVAAHHGSWELVAYCVAKILGKSFLVLAKPSRSKFWNRFIVFLRGRGNSQIIWNDSGVSVLRALKEGIANGQSVGFVMDQNPARRSDGVSIDFLGFKAQFVEGPAKFALRFGAHIVVTACVRTGPFQYKILFTQIDFDPSETTEELTRKMVSALQSQILQYPEQWCWEYKKWRF